jgi:hypothetical protein
LSGDQADLESEYLALEDHWGAQRQCEERHSSQPQSRQGQPHDEACGPGIVAAKHTVPNRQRDINDGREWWEIKDGGIKARVRFSFSHFLIEDFRNSSRRDWAGHLACRRKTVEMLSEVW